MASHTNTPSADSHLFGARRDSNSHTLHVHGSNANLPQSPCYYCISRLALLLVMLFFILSCVIVIAWYVIHPQDPAFRIESFSVSNVNLSDPQFTPNYDLEFTVKNTNHKVDILIHCVKVVVRHEKAKLAEKELKEPVSVRKMNATSLKAKLGMEAACSAEHRKFCNNTTDVWSKKTVNFDVEMDIGFQFELRIWPSKERSMKVGCKNLSVELSSEKGTGKLINGGKTCKLPEP